MVTNWYRHPPSPPLFPLAALTRKIGKGSVSELECRQPGCGFGNGSVILTNQQETYKVTSSPEQYRVGYNGFHPRGAAPFPSWCDLRPFHATLTLDEGELTHIKQSPSS